MVGKKGKKATKAHAGVAKKGKRRLENWVSRLGKGG